METIPEDLFIVDADSHWSEPPDLFTRIAPARYRDRVPRVEEIDGEPTWVFDGHPVGRVSAAAVIARDGSKVPAELGLFEWTLDDVHVGAYDPAVRLEVLDECGIDAQIIFPSTIGLGGEHLSKIGDHELSLVTIQLYNDAQAEIQAGSNNRLLPLPVLPAWDVAVATEEARRVGRNGARGINMTSDPQDLGAPDLASPDWDPFWEVCAELQLPVHFHIGASMTAEAFRGNYHWPSQAPNTQLALSGTLLFFGNARVVANAIVSGMFDRHPDLKMVSVESALGWVPFILEALDYEMNENAPEELRKLKKLPSEYFRSNLYATYWFEDQPRQAARPDRGDRRGQHPVRDRLPAPDVPVPEPPEVRRAAARGAHARGAAQDPGRERPEAVPALSRQEQAGRRPAARALS